MKPYSFNQLLKFTTAATIPISVIALLFIAFGVGTVNFEGQQVHGIVAVIVFIFILLVWIIFWAFFNWLILNFGKWLYESFFPLNEKPFLRQTRSDVE